ncbi:nucleolar protein 12-domain-containing protein [Apiospora kogelbergensis]|uniref:Nucleolar protein 12-domain-containing protein n=1 Tax=Apiospora kogelbergensis TaxID=1337665 RepID=A0AAW0QPE5_9PEZI
MFARPRPKKNILHAPSKKRKNAYSIEEISYDPEARSEYLTGFHKRKLQRVKNAQEQAAKQARQEKIDARREHRESRRQEVAEHVKTFELLLKSADRAGGVDSDEEGDEDKNEEWDGLPDAPAVALEPVDHEEEFIDEDKYTSVTVESVSVSRDGLYRPEEEQAAIEEEERKANESRRAAQGKVERPKKTKKPKFRYESKADRATNDRKLKVKKRIKANERRE